MRASSVKISGQLAVDADGALERQLAFEFAALAEQRGDGLGGARFARRGRLGGRRHRFGGKATREWSQPSTQKTSFAEDEVIIA